MHELEEMIGHVVRRLNQQSAQVFHRAMREADCDLTSVQFAALQVLDKHPGIDQAQLSALIAYDRATIGGVVERLEKRGYVARTVSPADRRARHVDLTDSGRDLLARVLPVVYKIQPEILAPLNDEERAQFLALARKALDIR